MQEMSTAPLHYCEMVTALLSLSKGGNFILKAFTLFEHPTICMMYIMACAFDELSVFKPTPSKPGNSETYIIGKGFRVSKRLLFVTNLPCVTPKPFQQRHIRCHQCLSKDIRCYQPVAVRGSCSSVDRPSRLSICQRRG